MVITPKGIMITWKEFNNLREYSFSLPTGTPIGKQWKRGEVKGEQTNWFLGEYVGTSRKDRIGIEWTPLILPETPNVR